MCVCCCSLKSLETLVQMGERIAVKPGSVFERTKSQKRQLALQTENSTVGIKLFQALDSSDTAKLGGTEASSDTVSEEELSSSAFATVNSEPQTLPTQSSSDQSAVPLSSGPHGLMPQSSAPQELIPQSSVPQSSGESSLHQPGSQQQVSHAQDLDIPSGIKASFCLTFNNLNNLSAPVL